MPNSSVGKELLQEFQPISVLLPWLNCSRESRCASSKQDPSQRVSDNFSLQMQGGLKDQELQRQAVNYLPGGEKYGTNTQVEILLKRDNFGMACNRDASSTPVSEGGRHNLPPFIGYLERYGEMQLVVAFCCVGSYPLLCPI